ncbi:unnamed protein product [Didymodactylos carnosus]|uniref:DED domain-containing protein n=1 Tax=Didymodactylos carnosus TaxID=1234261 RepID=A0A8S2CRT9_9BILA|nr:unnamed protein product [Didymodactylos carnosus]CAF3542132.1 unnamed protein product [Didymodactylos carnosus]
MLTFPTAYDDSAQDLKARAILVKIEDQLSDDNRRKLPFLISNDISRRTRDDKSGSSILNLFDELFDRAKITSNDFSYLIRVFELLECHTAVEYLREHQEQVVTTPRLISPPEQVSLQVQLTEQVSSKPRYFSMLQVVIQDREDDSVTSRAVDDSALTSKVDRLSFQAAEVDSKGNVSHANNQENGNQIREIITESGTSNTATLILAAITNANKRSKKFSVNNVKGQKVTQILKKRSDDRYKCPKCREKFLPQGIKNHMWACDPKWCLENNIFRTEKEERYSDCLLNSQSTDRLPKNLEEDSVAIETGGDTVSSSKVNGLSNQSAAEASESRDLNNRRSLDNPKQELTKKPGIANGSLPTLKKAKSRSKRKTIARENGRRIIEVLEKDSNGYYTCPGCCRKCKPQGIQNHVWACDNKWCLKNEIFLDESVVYDSTESSDEDGS